VIPDPVEVEAEAEAEADSEETAEALVVLFPPVASPTIAPTPNC
jgi:hypothetical protein